MENNKDFLETSKLKTETFKKIDFSQIPTSDEFQKIKVKPAKRWFNSLMVLSLIVLGISIGLILGRIIFLYA